MKCNIIENDFIKQLLINILLIIKTKTEYENIMEICQYIFPDFMNIYFENKEIIIGEALYDNPIIIQYLI